MLVYFTSIMTVFHLDFVFFCKARASKFLLAFLVAFVGICASKLLLAKFDNFTSSFTSKSSSVATHTLG